MLHQFLKKKHALIIAAGESLEFCLLLNHADDWWKECCLESLWFKLEINLRGCEFVT